jgi:hypothetical protein
MNNRKIFDKVMLGNDFMQDLIMNYEWLNRAATNPLRTDKNQSVFTMTTNIDGQEMVIPTVRLVEDRLVKLSETDAIKIALNNRDFIPVPSTEAGSYLSRGISNWLGRKDDK